MIFEQVSVNLSDEFFAKNSKNRSVNMSKAMQPADPVLNKSALNVNLVILGPGIRILDLSSRFQGGLVA